MLVLCHSSYQNLLDLIIQNPDCLIVTDEYLNHLREALGKESWKGKMVYQPNFVHLLHGSRVENHNVVFVTRMSFLVSQFVDDLETQFIKWHTGEIYLSDLSNSEENYGSLDSKSSRDTSEMSTPLGNKRYDIGRV